MIFIHPTAEVDPRASIGQGCRIWHHAQIREDAVLGPDCIVGKGAYIDAGVRIGARCKIQNYACLFRGTTLEDGVFVGPGALLANDRYPRAVNPDGSLKRDSDWEVAPVLVRFGASVGAGAVVLPGVTIGRWALVAAGAVVGRDVPDHALVAGVPARLAGWACVCGRVLGAELRCPACGRAYERCGDGLALRPGSPAPGAAP